MRGTWSEVSATVEAGSGRAGTGRDGLRRIPSFGTTRTDNIYLNAYHSHKEDNQFILIQFASILKPPNDSFPRTALVNPTNEKP
jgi:hypothetical protein